MINGIALSLPLLCGCLISSAIAYIVNTQSLAYNIIAVHYDVLIYPKEEYSLYIKDSSTISVIIDIIRSTTKIILPMIYLPIVNITITRRTSEKDQKLPTYKERFNIYDSEEQEVIVYFPTELWPGLYEMEMKIVDGHFLGTRVPAAFRYCYVTEDELIEYLDTANHKQVNEEMVFLSYWTEKERLKMNFSVTINYLEKNILHEYTIKNGEIWVHVQNLERTQNDYLMGLMLSNLIKIEKTLTRISVQIWYRKEMEYQLTFAIDCIEFITTRMIHIMGDAFDHNAHLNRTRLVNHVIFSGIRDDYRGGSMQTCRLIIYNESDVLVRDLDDYMRKINVERLIARKIICDFLGDLSYSLNEGLAAYLETYIINKDKGTQQVSDMYVVQDQRESLYLDYDNKPIELGIREPYQIRTPYYIPRYIKSMQERVN